MADHITPFDGSADSYKGTHQPLTECFRDILFWARGFKFVYEMKTLFFEQRDMFDCNRLCYDTVVSKLTGEARKWHNKQYNYFEKVKKKDDNGLLKDLENHFCEVSDNVIIEALSDLHKILVVDQQFNQQSISMLVKRISELEDTVHGLQSRGIQRFRPIRRFRTTFSGRGFAPYFYL